MNTEDIVTYEQALALKQLGFDEKCLYYYNVNEQIVANERDYQEEVSIKDLYTSYNSEYTSYNRIDAPTLAQVDKWLRSKGLWVEICLEPFDEKGWQFDIFNLKDHYYYNFAFSTVYDTYEKALSAGITECIKILEKGCQN